MALTPSKMLALGTSAPGFCLPDTISGKDIGFEDIRGERGTLVMFICNHCPYVIHLFREMVAVADIYKDRGIGVVAISSNDIEYVPDDSPDKMSIVAKVLRFGFPYLYDETQDVARAYDAACTPDFYLFDSDDKLYYRGRFDESRPNSQIEVTGKDLCAAMDSLLSEKEMPKVQFPSMGCNIKWK